MRSVVGTTGFIPDVKGRLAEGGRLQALAIDGLADSRNWNGTSFAPQAWQQVREEIDRQETA